MLKSLEHVMEHVLFASRWIMAPFYLGLVVALGALLVSFVEAVIGKLPLLLSLDETQMIVWVLSLIDLSLAANLLVMVIFSGYENFVSKMEASNHPDRPAWMGKIDFSGMKMKLIASIVAISAIQLLKAFMEIASYDKTDLAWMIAILMAFVSTGVMLALMDWIDARSPHR